MEIINFEKEISEFWKQNKISEKITSTKEKQPLFTLCHAPYDCDALPDINDVFLGIFSDIIIRYHTMQGFKIKKIAVWNNYRASIETKVKANLSPKSTMEIKKYSDDNFKEECQKLSCHFKQNWLDIMAKLGIYLDEKAIYSSYNNNYIEKIWQIIKQITEKNLLYYDSKETLYCQHCQINPSPDETIKHKKEKETDGQPTTCWICGNRLCYHSETGWFIQTKNIKQLLIENNQKINWLPSDIKEDINQWIDGLQDWKISTKCHWGMPLPIWSCSNCNFTKIITSKQELIEQQISKNIRNQYFILRAGTALFQEEFRNFVCSEWPEAILCPITDKGKEEIKLLAKKIKEEKLKIDLIFSSDFLRAKQTAEIIGEELKLKVNFSSQLREINYENKGQDLATAKSKESFYNLALFSQQSKNYENWNSCFKRMIAFLEKLEKGYENKTILIISHGDPLLILEARLKNLSDQEILDIVVNESRDKLSHIKPGELRKIEFKYLPVNLQGEIDLNSPYIDNIKLSCPKCQQTMTRVEEKINSSFESGCLPFIQNDSLFSNKNLSPEALVQIDLALNASPEKQNWHYNLLLINALLNVKNLYQAIIYLHPIINVKHKEINEQTKTKKQAIAKKTEPLSLSRILEQTGADTIRLYLYCYDLSQKTNIEIQPLKETSLYINRLWEIFLLFSFYINEDFIAKEKFIIKNQLDFWIISEINDLNSKITEALKTYKIMQAGNLIKNFIDNFSDYIKYSYLQLHLAKTGKEEKEQIFQIIYYVLFNFIKIAAPFIPFITEKLYQELKKYNIEVQEESLHLDHFPQISYDLIDANIKEKMVKIKEIINLCLTKRQEHKIKITQPLVRLDISDQELLADETFVSILKREINVKEISLGKSLQFDYHISPKLKQEGIFQEIIFQAKTIAKISDFPSINKVNIFYHTNNVKIKELLEKWYNYYKDKEDVFIYSINNIEFISKKSNTALISQQKEIVFDFNLEEPSTPPQTKHTAKVKQTTQTKQAAKKAQESKKEKISIWIGIQTIKQ